MLPLNVPITAGGLVTLDVGNANTGSLSTIVGTIHSSIRIVVNSGTGGGNILKVQLQTTVQTAANQPFYKKGLIFNGGNGATTSNPNVLDSIDPAGITNNVYCVDESQSTLYHGTSSTVTTPGAY